MVNLTQGQVVNLTKESKSGLTNVFFGAKWGAITHSSHFGFSKRTEDVDLDASLLIYGSSKTLIDTVYYGHKISRDGAIKHSGDDRCGGEVDGDNETISIDFSKVASQAQYIVAILNSYTHQKFDEIPYMKLRIYNKNETLCSYDVENNSSFKGQEAIVLGVFYKEDGTWQFKADGTLTQERSIDTISNGSAKRLIQNL